MKISQKNVKNSKIEKKLIKLVYFNFFQKNISPDNALRIHRRIFKYNLPKIEESILSIQDITQFFICSKLFLGISERENFDLRTEKNSSIGLSCGE